MKKVSLTEILDIFAKQGFRECDRDIILSGHPAVKLTKKVYGPVAGQIDLGTVSKPFSHKGCGIVFQAFSLNDVRKVVCIAPHKPSKQVLYEWELARSELCSLQKYGIVVR